MVGVFGVVLEIGCWGFRGAGRVIVLVDFGWGKGYSPLRVVGLVAGIVSSWRFELDERCISQLIGCPRGALLSNLEALHEHANKLPTFARQSRLEVKINPIFLNLT